MFHQDQFAIHPARPEPIDHPESEQPSPTSLFGALPRGIPGVVPTATSSLARFLPQLTKLACLPATVRRRIGPQILTLHSDRGAPMTSKCTAQLLADLGVTRSLSRPQVSDDNPFSEAQFKTLKYHPGFPGRPPPSPSVERSLGTTPSIDMAALPCCPSPSNPERAAPARAVSRLDPSSRTLRSRHPKTRPPARSGLDQSTREIHNRRNCSVNRNRQCLKVQVPPGDVDILDVVEHGQSRSRRLGLQLTKKM